MAIQVVAARAAQAAGRAAGAGARAGARGGAKAAKAGARAGARGGAKAARSAGTAGRRAGQKAAAGSRQMARRGGRQLARARQGAAEARRPVASTGRRTPPKPGSRVRGSSPQDLWQNRRSGSDGRGSPSARAGRDALGRRRAAAPPDDDAAGVEQAPAGRAGPGHGPAPFAGVAAGAAGASGRTAGRPGIGPRFGRRRRARSPMARRTRRIRRVVRRVRKVVRRLPGRRIRRLAVLVAVLGLLATSMAFFVAADDDEDARAAMAGFMATATAGCSSPGGPTAGDGAAVGDEAMAQWDETCAGLGLGAGGCGGVDPAEVAERTGSLDFAGSQIPPEAFTAYCAAAQAYEMDWTILAGVGKVECDHGRSRLPGCHPQGTVNPAGARGPMQFLGSTWRGSAGRRDPDVAGPPVCLGRDDQACERTSGYATDGDGDGIADPWTWPDATYSAARMLVANGVGDDPERAVFRYNHADWYVADVLDKAAAYREATGDLVVVSTAATPDRQEVLRRAASWLGPDGRGVPYGMTSYHDGWRTDCSGYVSMAWNLRTEQGDKVNATTVTLDSTHAYRIARSQLAPGDVLLKPAADGAGHVVLFERWDADRDYYWAYEQAGSTGTVHRRIRYPYDGRSGYSPYRSRALG
jgi:peptidoglycan DL-endopeptidase CwlO